jgi:hypothetical protein
MVSNTLISGKIVGTNLQIGTASLISPNRDRPFLADASVTNSFLTLDLSNVTPGPGDLEDGYYVKDCNGINSGPNALLFDSLSLNAYSTEGDLIGTVQEKIVAGPDAALPGALVYRLYSDTPFTFRGTCLLRTATGTVFTENNDLDIAQGWNTLVRSVDAQTITVRNAAAGNRAELTFVPATPRVAVQLKTPSLDFAQGQTVVVDAELIQVGDYSGTVSLSTNIAGLSIEPATVTLTPLPTVNAQVLGGRPTRPTALNVLPQKLSTKLTFRYTGTTSHTNTDYTVLIKDAGGKQVGSSNGKLNASRSEIGMFVSGFDLILAPNGSLRIAAQFIDPSRTNRDLTVTAENLPSGVRSTTETVNLKDTFATANLTLTSDASLRTGTYPITVTARGGGYSASTSVNVVTPKPSVFIHASGASYENIVYRGEPGFVQLDVKSQFGFNGETTVQILGLPRGVTSPPTRVTVESGNTTTVKVPLTVAGDAALETSQVTIVSADRTPPGDYEIPVSVTVRPARTELGSAASGFAPGKAGVWVGATQGSGTILKQFNAGLSTASTLTLAMPVSSLLPLPDGSVLAVNAAEARKISEAGTGEVYRVPEQAHTGVVDSQGRVWYFQTDTINSNFQTSIARWSPSTGEIKTVMPTMPNAYNAALVSSNDGKRILYWANNTVNARMIDVLAGTSTPVNIDLYTSSATVSDSGLVYFIAGNRVKRLNLDGSTTTFNFDYSFTKLIGLDVIQPDILWIQAYGKTARINLKKNEFKAISVGEISNAITLKDGGVGLIVYNYSSPEGFRYHLTVLK